MLEKHKTSADRAAERIISEKKANADLAAKAKIDEAKTRAVADEAKSRTEDLGPGMGRALKVVAKNFP